MRREDAAVHAASQVEVALWLYALLVVSVTAASWAFYWFSGIFMTRPLFAKYDQFHDLTNYIDKTAHLYRGAAALGAGLPIFTYPAPAAFVYKLLLYPFPGHPVRPFLTFLTICIVGFAFVAWRACRPGRAVRLSAAAAIVVTAVLGYPMWFVADRGNIEAVVWALAAAGLCLLLRGRTRSAAVLIGLSAAIKPFTILFLLLLLRHRRYKEAALGVATAGLMLLAALTVLGPNPWRAYQGLKPGISLYVARYVTNLTPVEEMRFNHSLLDGMKSAAVTVEMGGIYPVKALVEGDTTARGAWWMARGASVSARLPVCRLRRTRTVDCRLLPDANAQPIDRVSRGCDAFPAGLRRLYAAVPVSPICHSVGVPDARSGRWQGDYLIRFDARIRLYIWIALLSADVPDALRGRRQAIAFACAAGCGGTVAHAQRIFRRSGSSRCHEDPLSVIRPGEFVKIRQELWFIPSNSH